MDDQKSEVFIQVSIGTSDARDVQAMQAIGCLIKQLKLQPIEALPIFLYWADKAAAQVKVEE